MQGLQVKVSWYWGWSAEGWGVVEEEGLVGTEGEVVEEERNGEKEWKEW